MTFKVLYGLVPRYMMARCLQYVPVWSLRSLGKRLFQVLPQAEAKLACARDRTFSVVVPPMACGISSAGRLAWLHPCFFLEHKRSHASCYWSSSVLHRIILSLKHKFRRSYDCGVLRQGTEASVRLEDLLLQSHVTRG